MCFLTRAFASRHREEAPVCDHGPKCTNAECKEVRQTHWWHHKVASLCVARWTAAETIRYFREVRELASTMPKGTTTPYLHRVHCPEDLHHRPFLLGRSVKPPYDVSTERACGSLGALPSLSRRERAMGQIGHSCSAWQGRLVGALRVRSHMGGACKGSSCTDAIRARQLTLRMNHGPEKGN